MDIGINNRQTAFGEVATPAGLSGAGKSSGSREVSNVQELGSGTKKGGDPKKAALQRGLEMGDAGDMGLSTSGTGVLGVI